MLHFLREFVSFLPLGETYYRNQSKLLMSPPHEGMEFAEILLQQSKVFQQPVTNMHFQTNIGIWLIYDLHW